jgi:tRNA 2-selenouridine synthase
MRTFQKTTLTRQENLTSAILPLHSGKRLNPEMASRPDTDNYLSLFLNDTPLMDVRAPVEFARGSFPCAENAPLMNDEERHRVGVCYKEKGQDEAIRLGHQLVSGDIKAQRIEAWKRFVARHPEGYLFCFRGGLRSSITQQWIRDAGIDFPLVKDGYKTLRRFLIDSLDNIIESGDFRIISGRTGTGKTRVLQQLPNPVDLEGLANHRGSSFGRQVTPQPSQIDFENRLAVSMLKAHHLKGGPVYLEDESRLVGRCVMPDTLKERIDHAPLLILERPMEDRTRIIREDYVEAMSADYMSRDGEEAGWLNFRDYLLGALDRISKRLGGERHRQLRSFMEQALARQGSSGDVHPHDAWIQPLLQDYYDPMYDYQLSHKQGQVLVRGGPDAVAEWASDNLSA